MNQHPIPQNVTSYQFRLIGDMTIQQFIFLSIGIAGAIFFYYTNLFSIIKWTLIAGSAMGGFAVAFMPIEDRPLDQWIVNYIKAIYQPTRFVWRKTPKTPEMFTFVTNAAILPADADEISRIAAARRQQGLQSFLVTLPSETEGNMLDLKENAQTTDLIAMFSTTNSTTATSTPIASTTNINILPQETMTPPQASTTSEVGKIQPKHQISGVISTAPISIKQELSPPPTELSQNIPTNSSQPESKMLTMNPTNTASVEATTSSQLPFPSTPTTPNTIVGMILDQNDKIVENAIIEVSDEAGFPVRATKSNQLGQFFSTTPLKRGDYQLDIEKAGLNFDTIKLTLNGQILEPLKIVAKS